MNDGRLSGPGCTLIADCQEVITMTTSAPGRAIVEQCRPCEGSGLEGKGRCLDCGGSGYLVWRACPRCGSLQDWEYRDGASETSGMICRACGTSWDMDQPEWVVQVLPDEFLADTT